MRILKNSELDIGAKILRDGGLIAFPTETVFGLGVIYDKKESYDRLVAVKRRPPQKPFTVMLADTEDIEKYAELNEISKELVKAFMPGQFTLITKAKPGLPAWCVTEEGNIGLRIADYDLIRELIRKTEKPLLVPSANKAGENPATTDEEVVNIFEGEIDACVEGKSISNTPSTIVMMDGNKVQIIRAGIITEEQINKVLKAVR